jgi:serine O-acetyltransferase
MWKTLQEDIQIVFERDPAARTVLEIVLTYPGFHALFYYRVAHNAWTRGLKGIARFISNLGRFFTGIEIHPGAKIGRRFFIDHGMGVVIGETCEIKDNVTIYQGVTLGGTGKEKGKRHPTVEDNVLISTGAKVLGSITIGRCSKVGGGSVVLKDVPPHSTVVGIPGRVVVQNGTRVNHNLDHTNLPDPVQDLLHKMEDEIQHLKAEVYTLREQAAHQQQEQTHKQEQTHRQEQTHKQEQTQKQEQKG